MADSSASGKLRMCTEHKEPTLPCFHVPIHSPPWLQLPGSEAFPSLIFELNDILGIVRNKGLESLYLKISSGD